LSRQLLSKVLRERADHLRGGDDPAAGLTENDRGDYAELLRVLARMVEGKSLYQSFGAPGDWGYDTPIGDALSAIYKTPDVQEPVRPAVEIQRAHDLLHALVTGEFTLAVLSADDLKHLHACLDVLCWVLRHDHNKHFAGNLTSVEHELNQAGVVLKQGGQEQ
jgi:hypothetical protein